MSDSDDRTPGVADVNPGWEPIWPPLGAELDVPQQLACAARILARSGFSENYAGHITCMADRESFWSTPWGKWWGEMRASDMVLVDLEGRVLKGDLTVSPAIHIHTGIHQRRPDARSVIHNHPRYGTLLASHLVQPRIFTQTGLLLEGEIRLVASYTGAISEKGHGLDFAGQVAEGLAFLLANHGVITVGADVPSAVYAAETLEIVCRQTFDASQLGTPAVELPEQYQAGLKGVQADISVRAYWEGAVRQLLAEVPEVLE